MPIALIIAIIELIIKLPEIIKSIQAIIDAIHNRPLHLQGGLIGRLEVLVSNAHAATNFLGGDPSEDLVKFAEELRTA